MKLEMVIVEDLDVDSEKYIWDPWQRGNSRRANAMSVDLMGFNV